MSGAAKKGRFSQPDIERENESEFVNLRKQHAAVESTINALGVHGIDKCPYHGLKGFKRYVPMAVVARNIQRLAVSHQQYEEAVIQRAILTPNQQFKTAAF